MVKLRTGRAGEHQRIVRRSGEGFEVSGQLGLDCSRYHDHARVLAIGGHLNQACDLAVAAYDVGCSYESERVRQAVRQFRPSLGGQVAPRVTAELDDRLHSAYTTRST